VVEVFDRKILESQEYKVTAERSLEEDHEEAPEVKTLRKTISELENTMRSHSTFLLKLHEEIRNYDNALKDNQLSDLEKRKEDCSNE